jgi:hypothetical protein
MEHGNDALFVGAKTQHNPQWMYGATASARLYSLVETAKANRVEPHAYLTHLFTHLPAATTVDEFEALLPWNVKIDSSVKPRPSP